LFVIARNSQKYIIYEFVNATILRGRIRNRLQDEVREDERLIGGKTVERNGL
jgi:hypothetical protein